MNKKQFINAWEDVRQDANSTVATIVWEAVQTVVEMVVQVIVEANVMGLVKVLVVLDVQEAVLVATCL